MGLSVKHSLVRSLSGKSKGSEGVHDEIDPEDLDRSEYVLSEDGSAHEDDSHGHDVHSKLELEELANTVEDVAAEHNASDCLAEVVRKQNNASGKLCSIRARVHRESNMGFLESWGVIGSVPCHSHNAGVDVVRVGSLEATHERELVFWRRVSHHSEILSNLSKLL